MDSALLGHAYAKAPVDVACWDIQGKATGQPLMTLLGGKAQKDVVLYRAISQIEPAAMTDNVAQYRAEGYTRFQLKAGADADSHIARIRLCAQSMQPGEVLVADANTGWTMHEAARVVNAVHELDVYIEQPSPSHEECLVTRRRSPLPFILDEVITDIGALRRGLADGAMDVINLKISKVGGLTRARQMRDLCLSAGIPMPIEVTWGSDIVTTSIAHLAQSTPAEFALSVTDFNSYGTVSIAANAPRRINGRMQAAERPGLGVTPDRAVLGKPVLEMV